MFNPNREMASVSNRILVKMVSEILDYHNTGILSDGEVRNFAARCKELDIHNSLTIAENTITREALKRFNNFIIE